MVKEFIKELFIRPVFKWGNYWGNRYAKAGNSGDELYGLLATFKADVINKFIEEHSISSVLELGRGDGHQLSLMNYQKYTGLDSSFSFSEWKLISKIENQYPCIGEQELLADFFIFRKS
ncbi:MAG: hypothetical protein ABIU30_12650 [Ferruginibacter sp.]